MSAALHRKISISVGIFLWCSIPTTGLPASSGSAPIYTYKDDAGTVNFTTELYSIPEKYRSRAVPLELESSSPVEPDVQQPPRPQVRVVTASGEYRMGDHDTRIDAVRLAVEAAKREALEQVATYLESVTEVRDMDVTRDDIRTYTAGVVMVLDQKISTRLDGNTVVIRADLTAQVDPDEVAHAIAALRENESAKNELTALRAETDQLHQQLDAANSALATAVSPEQAQSLNQQRQDVLNQLQANALVSQAWTDWIYVTPIIYPYPWIGVQQVHGLLLQARQVNPQNRHLQVMQQVVTVQTGAQPPTPPPGILPPVPPHTSLLVPQPAPLSVTPPPKQSLSPGSSAPASGVHEPGPPAARPLPNRSSPLPLTLQQIHPPHLAQPNLPVLRAPYSVPREAPPSHMSPQHFGGGGGRLGGGHRGR